MASSDQLKIAALLNLDVAHLAERVASARILDVVALAILEKAPAPSTSRQRAFGKSLGLDLGADSVRVASARIEEAIQLRNQEAAERMKLTRGVAVVVESRADIDGRSNVTREVGVVSSVRNGMVYFIGGNGRCAGAARVRLPTRREATAIGRGKHFL